MGIGHLYPGPHITAFIHRMANTGKGLQLLPGILNRERGSSPHTHTQEQTWAGWYQTTKKDSPIFTEICCTLYPFEPIPISHKRRIKTEEEAKVVTAVWETLLNSSWGLKTWVELSLPLWAHGERLNSTQVFSSHEKLKKLDSGGKYLVRQEIELNWINAVPQTAATSFVFSSVYILLQCHQYRACLPSSFKVLSLIRIGLIGV